MAETRTGCQERIALSVNNEKFVITEFKGTITTLYNFLMFVRMRRYIHFVKKNVFNELLAFLS